LAYRVIAEPAVREQISDAPPVLQGYVAGAVALLRVDPLSASVAFTIVDEGDFRTLVFPGGRGFLRYVVVEEDQVVFLVDLTWI
jgi:hypothetical protein